MPAPSVTYTFTNGTAADAAQVNTNFTDLINGASDGTKDYSINALTAAGTATLNGNVILGSSSADDLTLNASLASTIPVKTTASFDIGSSTLGLRALYFGANSQTVNITGSGSMSATWTMTLPVTAGSAGDALQNSGSGTLVWMTPTCTVQKFTSGSGTYNRPTNAKWIRVRLVGGGGGGAGSGTVNGTASTSGGATTFGTTLLSGSGGAGGSWAINATAGGAASLGTGPSGLAVTGNWGMPGTTIVTGMSLAGGAGGGGPFGGNGGGSSSGANAPDANTGSGGAGGGLVVAGTTGAGGGAGGFVDAIITSPSSSYAYAVGAAGSGGGAGTSGSAGGNGAAGVIIVEEYYT